MGCHTAPRNGHQWIELVFVVIDTLGSPSCRDVPQEALLQFPSLYSRSRLNKEFNFKARSALFSINCSSARLAAHCMPALTRLVSISLPLGGVVLVDRRTDLLLVVGQRGAPFGPHILLRPPHLHRRYWLLVCACERVYACVRADGFPPITPFLASPVLPNGHPMDMFLFGITISTSAITIVTLKLAIETKYVVRSFVRSSLVVSAVQQRGWVGLRARVRMRATQSTWTVFHHLVFWGSLGVYFFFISIYGLIPHVHGWDNHIYWAFGMCLLQPSCAAACASLYALARSD